MTYIVSSFVVFGALALISRKHFSKYKGIKGLFLSMAETVSSLLFTYLLNGRIKKYIRKTNVTSERQVQSRTRTFIVESVAIILVMIVSSGLLAGIINMLNRNDESLIIKRPSYDSDSKEIAIKLDDADGELEVLLDVAPVEFSKEEFESRADETSLWVEEAVLLDNVGVNSVCSDLYFPESDQNGFDISWKSDCPEVISSWGKVYTENVGAESRKVKLTYTISYLDYQVSHEILVSVLSNDSNIYYRNEFSELKKLESESRNLSEFELPQEINGLKVSIAGIKDNKPLKVLLFGIFVGVIMVTYRCCLLGRAAKDRDDFLVKSFPDFVNKMCLYIESGMTIRGSLKQYTTVCENESILKQEIEYTINMLETGEEETLCYEQLGFRLGIPCYYRLFGDIAQNIRMGGRDLLKLMRASLITAREVKVEYVRKKGEQASTKLLLPMGLLLLVVMAIVVAPAIMTY